MRLAIVAAAALVATGLAAPEPARAQQDDSLIRGGAATLSCREATTGRVRSNGIAGGQDAEVDDFPFVVQVRVGDSLCGGSLIAPGFVLTAAHCVMSPPGVSGCPNDGTGVCPIADAGEVTVIRPDPIGRARGERAGVTHVFAHPEFRYPISANDRGGLDADVAVLRLDREFDGPSSQYVTVADDRFDASFASGGECARVAGWGLTDVLDSRLRVVTRGKETDRLQSLNLEIVDRDRCKARYSGQITDNMLCAGDGIEGFNTCKGDSGGPLVVDVGVPVQVGIVSWAYGCAQAEHYTVFTRVGSAGVRGWINETILGR